MRTRIASITVALCLLAMVAPRPIAALDVKEGFVRLVVNEANARISVYKLVDVARGRYESLLFEQDPRTTFATLSIDGRQVKLGDAADYRFTVARTDTGARIEFRSSFCVVRQLVDFAKSAGAALPDGVRVTFELENVSERDSSLGIRYLVDTYLAEKSGVHFATDKRSRINEETVVNAASGDSWIATPGEKLGFMVMMSGSEAERPDRAVIANWKRLSDAPWAIDVNPQRNFTLVPYSINDSAVALFWEPVAVPRGGTRKVSLVMGAYNEHGYPPAAESVRSSTESIFAATVLDQPAANVQTAIAGDLVAVRDLISRIDRAVATGAKISDEEIATWKKILDRLEERKKSY